MKLTFILLSLLLCMNSFAKSKAAARLPTSSLNSSFSNFELTSVVAMTSGFWSVKKDSDEYFGRYKAYILSQKDDKFKLYVYMEKEGLKSPKLKLAKGEKIQNLERINDSSKFVLVAQNDSFIWGSDWAGTEPNLKVNGRGSLVVETMNEGVGRSPWNQKVTLRLNPTNSVLEVIGFDYTTYDKLDLSSTNCSYNFNTGEAIINTLGPAIDDSGNDIKKPTKSTKKIKISDQPMNVNDWKDSSEMKILEDCMKD